MLILAIAALPALPQSRGVESIHGDEMKPHLRFLAAPEFKGRVTPSPEGDIAARYIAETARRIGLKPLLPDGFFQNIPVDERIIKVPGSYLKLNNAQGEKTFELLEDFGVGRLYKPGKSAGNVVFLGYGLEAPKLGWNDYAGIDVKGKIVVILDVDLPKEHVLKPQENARELKSRIMAALRHGAAAIVYVVSEDIERQMAAAGQTFEMSRDVFFPDIVTDQRLPSKRFEFLLSQIFVRQDAGAAILGISRAELAELFAAVRRGERPAARELPGTSLELSLNTVDRKVRAANVVGWIEGSDPKLKNEYVVISSHYDHVMPRDGKINPGADDNASGAVGMFEIAEAMMIERPKRSVIFLWNAAEEDGLMGAYYFIEHCPVPVEAISADLNLDMISRNATDQFYIIGAKTLSTELDRSIREANDRGVGFRLDASYDAMDHPEHFFFRSDHYPFVRHGIPGLWFFCGTTADYHRAGDVEEKCDYAKMEKASRLVYLTAMDIGNRPALLKLDADPRVTTRGAHNMKVEWMKGMY